MCGAERWLRRGWRSGWELSPVLRRVAARLAYLKAHKPLACMRDWAPQRARQARCLGGWTGGEQAPTRRCCCSCANAVHPSRLLAARLGLEDTSAAGPFFPVFQQPARPLGVLDVMNALRVHYQGTPHDPYANQVGCPQGLWKKGSQKGSSAPCRWHLRKSHGSLPASVA